MADGVKGRGGKLQPARDLAVEAEQHATGRQAFVKHVFTRLPLVSAFVITINLFVQVRGDIGLAVAIAQNLTFGAIAVIVLLNLVTYIMVGVMVVLMPMVFDADYNLWIRVVGSVVLVLFSVVLGFTASWPVLAVLVVVFLAIALVVRRRQRTKEAPALTRTTIGTELESAVPPVDTELRTLWADGRAMLRVISPSAPPLTPVEDALDPAPTPRTLADVADDWNARAALIRGPGSKSLTRVAFAGIVGFVAIFGLIVLTQPIRFAPLELVSIKGEAPQPGFVLLTGARGLFVPDPFGTAQFISTTDLTSVALCDVTPTWWSASIAEMVAPGETSGPDCGVS